MAKRKQLTDDEVEQIKKDYIDGWSQAEIAEAFGVSGATVGGIVTGRTHRKALSPADLRDCAQFIEFVNSREQSTRDRFYNRHRLRVEGFTVEDQPNGGWIIVGMR